MVHGTSGLEPGKKEKENLVDFEPITKCLWYKLVDQISIVTQCMCVCSVCVYVCMCVYVCVYVCVSVCVYVCVCA